MQTNNNDVVELDLYAEQAYLAYAMSVVKGRAIPSAIDGQKPVQRRILYAMHDMNIAPGTKPVKSARVVGEVLGKYHPHGDAAAYEAMVRMAQDFSLRYPMVDGQGNFGSRCGDQAAASRYTECRLSKYSDLVLSELDNGTVKFQPNYDNSEEEPVVLPARLPMVLLNGASGIAVGMACEIPPHNIVDVANAAIALIDKPISGNDVVAQCIQAPDFPGGGQIISDPDEIQQCYTTGRGSIRVRARFTFENLARGQWQLVVTELPPGSSTMKVMTEIEECVNPKVKAGKKSLSPEQARLKFLFNAYLERMKDDSDTEHPIRLVLQPKTSKINRDEFLAIFLQHTSMEVNVPFNLVVVRRDGTPKQSTLREVLIDWLDSRREMIYNRSFHRLSKIERQLNLLHGRRIAFLNLDAVIKVIREHDEPKPILMQRFKLNDAQAEDILEIKLRQLTKLEGVTIDRKIAELEKEATGIRKLLGKNLTGHFDLRHVTKALDGEMRKEIVADAAKYGDPRRTLILPAASSVAQKVVKDEAVTLTVTEQGWVKVGAIALKKGDAIREEIATRTTWPMVVIDSNGRTYSILVNELTGLKGEGVPISTLFQLNGGKVISVFSNHPDTSYLLASRTGYGFICPISGMMTRQKAGKATMTIYGAQGDAPLPPYPVIGKHIVMYADDGRILAIEGNTLPRMSIGRGLQLMARKNIDHAVISARYVDGDKFRLQYRTRNDTLAVMTAMPVADYLGERGSRGKPTKTAYKEAAILP